METKKQRVEKMTKRHTPGPWQVLPDPVWKDKHPLHEARYVATSVEVECSRLGWGFVDERSSIICTMPDAENQQQNARLIACAPELLEALKRMWVLWEDVARSNPGFLASLTLQDYENLNLATIEAPKAIARAEGRA